MELWTFLHRFREALDLQQVPSISELEQAFAKPGEAKSATTAALVSQTPHLRENPKAIQFVRGKSQDQPKIAAGWVHETAPACES